MIVSWAVATLVFGAAPVELTLDEALRRAGEVSLRGKAEAARLAVAKSEEVVAGTFPNPTLSYGTQSLVAGESTGALAQHVFQLEQPLPIFGTWDARVRLAQRSLDVEREAVAETWSARRLAVRQAFFSLLSRQQRVSVLDETAKDLERVRQVVQGRAAVGESSKYDLARIDLEAGALGVERAAAHAEEEEANGMLAVALGAPGAHFRAAGSLEPGTLPSEAEALWAVAEQRRPALRVLREKLAAAHVAVTLARREGVPVPTINTGVVATRAVGGVSLSWGVSLPIPAFDRNQGPLAKAEAQAAYEQRNLEAETMEAHAELDRAVEQLAARRAAKETYVRDVASRLPQLRQMADDAYRGGKGGILELLDAFRSFKEARLLEVQQDEGVKQAEAMLIAAAALDVP